LHLYRRKLGLHVGGAIEAQHAFVVPTGHQADPAGALGALAEIRFGFLDRVTKRLVVPGALDRAFDLVGRTAHIAQNAAEDAAESARRSRGHAHGGWRKFGHESVMTAVAEKLELVPLIGGMVAMVSGELNQAHGSPRVFSRRPADTSSVNEDTILDGPSCYSSRRA